jgi:phage baseplate assembly protein W
MTAHLPSAAGIPAFPLRIDESGQTARAVSARALAEQRIEQLLFTSPGERVNRPTFGSALIELIFGAVSDEVRAAVTFQLTSSLQEWLSPAITVISVQVSGAVGEIAVTVTYQLPGEPAANRFTVTA